jgi:propanediol utilization protein
MDISKEAISSKIIKNRKDIEILLKCLSTMTHGKTYKRFGQHMPTTYITILYNKNEYIQMRIIGTVLQGPENRFGLGNGSKEFKEIIDK